MQCFPTSGLFDVTFWKKEDLQTCLLWKGDKVEDPLLEGVTFLCSESKCPCDSVYVQSLCEGRGNPGVPAAVL